MLHNPVEVERPGVFSEIAAADNLRYYFDLMNQTLIARNTSIDFLFFGDSITQGWELNAYFSPRWMTVNRGIGGDRTRYARLRFKADVLDLKPRHCIMMIGINDAWDLEPDLWHHIPGRGLDEVLEEAYGNLEMMADMARDVGQSLILCSVLPTNMSFTFAEEARKQYVVKLNAKLKTLCEKRGIPYVDYFSAFVLEDGRTANNDYLFEGLHPHVTGYDLMAKVLEETLPQYGIDI